MTLLGKRDEIAELLEYHGCLPIPARRFDADQAHRFGVERLFSGVFEGCGQARAKGGLNPAHPPFGALRVTHPIAGRKMAGRYGFLHVPRIDGKVVSVDACRSWPGGYSREATQMYSRACTQGGLDFGAIFLYRIDEDRRGQQFRG